MSQYVMRRSPMNVLQEIAAEADEGFQDTMLMSFFHQI